MVWIDHIGDAPTPALRIGPDGCQCLGGELRSCAEVHDPATWDRVDSAAETLSHALDLLVHDAARPHYEESEFPSRPPWSTFHAGTPIFEGLLEYLDLASLPASVATSMPAAASELFAFEGSNEVHFVFADSEDAGPRILFLIISRSEAG